ncbi:MAG: Hsp20/alpha crystallin family protein [Deltaproteobacteria bacterium]|nr:Hsp20/alpha crystallin family protein [Deltaproteobacteria bacterium]
MFRKFLPELQKNSLKTQRPTSMADLLEDFWKSPFDFMSFRDLGYPAVDISENDKQISIKAELPGMEPTDIDLQIEGNALIIKGEKKFEEKEIKDNFHRLERSYGSFSRTIPLPGPVNQKNVMARFDKGILTIIFEKAPEKSGTKIQIQS